MICGLPLYEYDHIVPFSEVQRHDPQNLVLLCDQHHREKTSRLLPIDAITAARDAPFNLTAGHSQPYHLHYSGEQCEAIIGSNVYVWPTLTSGAFGVPLIVDDTPLVLFRAEANHLLLSAQLFDNTNELLVQIIDNELVFSASPWDVELVGPRLTIRGAPRDIFVRMTFEPPNRVLIDRGHVWRNGIEIRMTSDELLLVNDGTSLSQNTMVNAQLGLAIGNPPPGLGAAIRTAPSRQPYVTDATTEQRVLRLIQQP